MDTYKPVIETIFEESEVEVWTNSFLFFCLLSGRPCFRSQNYSLTYIMPLVSFDFPGQQKTIEYRKRSVALQGLVVYSIHCVKNVCIWSFSGPYSVRMRENKCQ